MSHGVPLDVSIAVYVAIFGTAKLVDVTLSSLVPLI
jgi:hypothetical protein